MILAVVNPAAGGGRCGARAPEVLQGLADEGIEIEVVHTEEGGHATSLAREAWERGVRRFIAVGGDGTGWEVLNGVLPLSLASGERPWLGYLPLGTGNSFLKDFGDGDVDHALGALRKGEARATDAIKLTHDEGELYYVNLMTLGFAADVADATNRMFKPFGGLAYGLGVVWTTLGLKARALPYAADDGPLRDAPQTFTSFSNSRFTGGTMNMAPGADTADGLVDIIHAGPLGRVGLLRTFPKIFAGTHVEHPAVDVVQAREVRFSLQEPVAVMIDGESMIIRPTHLEVLPGVLDVCA